MRQPRVALWGSVLVILACALPASVRAQESPSKSVFQVWVMAHTNEGPYRSQYHAIGSGTAFFISSDGTALTSSHVVYPAHKEPMMYQLLGVIRGEFYGVRLICASDLPYDPTNPGPKGVPVGRDVAEIRVTPPQVPFDQLVISNVPYARAHRGPLPAFPALRLGADPSIGDPVRVLGFGRISSPLPYEWSAEGTVSRLGNADDGTPLFGMTFSRPTEPGDSGAPVLNALDQVVGIYNWHSMSDHTLGTAISRSALDPACSSPSATPAPGSSRPAVVVPSLGSVALTKAVTARGVESQKPRDEVTEFKLGDDVYAYIKLRIPRVGSGDAGKMVPALWKWTAPSGETFQQEAHWVLQEGWTNLYTWRRLPSFVGMVQQPVGTWHVEVIIEDVLVAKIEFTLAP